MIVEALGLSVFIGVPILFLPQPELVYFYLPFALFGVGLFAGRATFLGSLGFVGGTLGGFVGIYLFQLVSSQLFLIAVRWPIWPIDWALMILAFAATCGLGGAASGKLGLKRMQRRDEHAAKMRRCLKCGVKVGISARKCWSCRSYLPPT